MASQPIYQFYVKLNDFTPTIWRRFKISNHISVARLAYTIMIMFEMKASHLFAVQVNSGEHLLHALPNTSYHAEAHALMANVKTVYELPNFNDLYDNNAVLVENAAQTALRKALDAEGQTMQLNYDFGDDWWVTLTLEKIITDHETPGSHYPVILDGEGFGIIEDCGGSHGLKNLVEAFTQKHGEDYEQFKTWLGVETFDIHAFDIDDLNFRIKKLPIIYKYIYEDQKPLTKRAIDLLERQ